MMITLGNLLVWLTVLSVGIGILIQLARFTAKIIRRWDDFQRKYDIALRIGVEYFYRTGNNLAYPLVKEYEELYGRYPGNASGEHDVPKEAHK